MNALSPAQTQLISDALAATQKYIAARAAESNTHYGAIGAAIAAQPIAENLSQAIIAGLSHDFPTAMAKAIPALMGIFGVIAAIVTPQPKLQIGEIQTIATTAQ